MKYLLGGDIALGDHPKSVGFGFLSKYRKGIPTDLAERVFPRGVRADVRFGNLEFILDDLSVGEVDFDNAACRGDLLFLPWLNAAGFNVMNLANNHIYQFGRTPFEKSREGLKKNGIAVCGIASDPACIRAPDAHKSEAVFVGWCNRPRQYSYGPPPYNELETPKCFEQVRNLAKQGRDVCVSIHWGEEFVSGPSPSEREMARALIDAGATIVVGHHPHVLREVERYHNGIIAYSLGNLVGDMIWDPRIVQTGCLYVETADQRVVDSRFYTATLGSDYFPHYDEKDGNLYERSPNNERWNGRTEELSVSDRSYKRRARLALLHHQILTALHLVRNRRNYPSGYIRETLRRAFRDRLG